MKYINIAVLIIGLSVGVMKTTHAEDHLFKNITTVKDNKTVIELKKDIKVNTNLNLDKTLAQLNLTEASNIPKIRKVTPVDNDSVERKIVKIEVQQNGTTTTTTVSPPLVNKVLTEGGIVNKTVTLTNANSTTDVAKDAKEKKLIVLESKNTTKIDTLSGVIAKNDTQILKQKYKNNTLTTTIETSHASSSTIAAPNSSSTTLIITTTTTTTTSTIATPATNSITTTTTTTTTTPKPKKPTITYGVEDFPDLDKNNPELKKLPQSTSSSSQLPIPPDAPYAQPSQEFNNTLNHGRDYILPIVSMLFIIPLVIGILITSYRRFRDCWSTRHYRRMDFLVDGMYND